MVTGVVLVLVWPERDCRSCAEAVSGQSRVRFVLCLMRNKFLTFDLATDARCPS